MHIAPKGMLSVTDFAQHTKFTPEEIVNKLHAGLLAGRCVENDWYVERAELAKADGERPSLNHVTAIMLAAANTNWREILDAIDLRRMSPIKAETPEYGLNIGLVHAEATLARRRNIGFNIMIGVAALVGIGLVAGSTSNIDDMSGYDLPWSKLVIAFLLIAVADLLSRRGGLKRARAIIKQLANSAVNGEVVDHTRNVNISGGYSPFVGSGNDAGGWSFTVSLTEPEKAGMPVEPTTVNDLYAETTASLDKLAIPVMAVKDEAFVDGRDVRGLPVLTPTGPYNRPERVISAAAMAQLMGSSEYALRHYKVIRLELWDGQIVLSIFFRYTIVSRTLYVENRTLILPPLLEKFSKLQNMPLVPTSREFLRDVAKSTLLATVIWIPVLLAGVNFIQGGFFKGESRWYKTNKKEVEENQKYNYGWPTSLRETWSGTEYNRYFQMADKDFYSKMVQETLLDSLLKSLEKRNISTAGLKDASTRIYNEGIIVNGGTLHAESIAAGTGAQSTVKNGLRAAANMAPKA